MIELFEEHKVSFVFVTQQFNTTTSMGRLTLNILPSLNVKLSANVSAINWRYPNAKACEWAVLRL
ncbi:hypothetical protein [Bartonella sp. CM100XJJH]|uniref:hypothetical protein n=1 Tax=Bartonella sp. CM100XJJH TaxID=3243543 RepID=UPI0035CF149F